MGPFDKIIQPPPTTRAKVRKEQNAQVAQAMWDRAKQKRKANKGPKAAQLLGTSKRAPDASDAVGPMQDILQAGMSAGQG